MSCFHTVGAYHHISFAFKRLTLNVTAEDLNVIHRFIAMIFMINISAINMEPYNGV